MKLPATHELTFEAAQFLSGHDVAGLHCGDEHNFYSQMTKARTQSVIDSLVQNTQTGRLLDLGCAQGNIALLSAELGFEAWAVNLRAGFLRYAVLKHERGLLRRVAANAEQLPFPAHFFDAVVWGEMIEHVAYPEKILTEIRRVLLPKGLLLLTTPNGTRLRTGLPTFSAIKDRGEFEARQFQPDSDGHLFLYRQDELEALLTSLSFSVVRHQYTGTPWISGRLGFRHWMNWMDTRARRRFEQWTLKIAPLAQRLAEGQVLLARSA